MIEQKMPIIPFFINSTAIRKGKSCWVECESEDSKKDFIDFLKADIFKGKKILYVNRFYYLSEISMSAKNEIIILNYNKIYSEVEYNDGTLNFFHGKLRDLLIVLATRNNFLAIFNIKPCNKRVSLLELVDEIYEIDNFSKLK